MHQRTSTEAFRRITEEGLLPRRRLEVFNALAQCAPATAMEVFQHMVKVGGSKVAANVYARLSELREQGTVKQVGTSICRITGMEVFQWDITGELPRPVPKRVKVTCPHCGGKGYAEE